MHRREFTVYRKIESIKSDDSDTSDCVDLLNQTSKYPRDSKSHRNMSLFVSSLQQQIQNLSLRAENLNNRAPGTSELDNADRERPNENDDSASLSEGTNVTITSSMKELKSHLELITEFEGNNISVETFIFETKTVLNEIPNDLKKMFIRLIISKKITKFTRKMIDGHDIRSPEDLFQTLRNNFGENKSLDVALLERSQCQQGYDTVLMYNKKFCEYHLDVKRAINNNPDFDAQNRSIILTNEEKQGLAQYIRGLRPSLKLFVKAGKPQTIREAQNLALETEKEEVMTRILYKKPIIDNSKIQSKPNIARNSALKHEHLPSTTIKQKFPCHGCGSTEHFIKNCPKNNNATRNFQTRILPSVPPNQIKYTECQKTEEIPEQPSDLESIQNLDNAITHSWQTQELQ